MLLENARIGEHRVQPGRPLAAGRAPRRTGSRRWCASRIRTRRGITVHDVPVRVRAVRSRHLARRTAPVGVDERGRTATSTCACGSSTSSLAGRHRRRCPSSASASRCPRASCSRSDGRYLYGSSYYTGVSNIFRYEVATGDVEAVSNAETGFFRPVPLADGRLVVLNYTGEGFVPAIIDPRPIEDVSAITFLGAEVAAKHPVVTTWQVPPPSTVDDEKLVIGEGAVRPAGEHDARERLPGAAGLQGLRRRRLPRSTSRIRSSFAKVGITAAYTPDDEPAGQRARPRRRSTAHYLGWRGGLAWNRSDFYDLFGPTKRSRKGYAAKLGYDQLLIYDDPRRLEVSSTSRTTTRSTRCRMRRTSRRRSTRLVHRRGRACTTPTCAARSAPSTTRRAWPGRSSPTGQPRARRLDAADARHASTTASRCRSPNSSLWLRSAAGGRQRRPRQPARELLLRRLRQQLRRRRRGQALPRVLLVPRLRDQRDRAGSTSCARWSSGTCRRWCSNRSATPGFHLALAAAGGVRVGAVDRSGELGAAQGLRERRRAVRPAHFSVLHWYDMTLSVGYAVGYQSGKRRSGTEWMISLKIM